MDLLSVRQMIALEGRHVKGAGPDSACAIEEKLHVSGKPWCAVCAWVLIDVPLDVTTDPLPKPMLPMVMYAHFRPVAQQREAPHRGYRNDRLCYFVSRRGHI
ncbi:hypothetical protein ALO95_200091 [Pseudomonas syringae pv. antirrhini]|nr:hypothetical protein ALQ23_200022 [Pseudomonas syringae pv. antirrhini]RMW23490.1 hypothetical protein ALO95_200091 [Pseudomonas syringae pv. antirrhini]